MDIVELVKGNLLLTTRLLQQRLALLQNSKDKQKELEHQVEIISRVKDQAIFFFETEQTRVDHLVQEKQSLSAEVE